MGASSVKSAAPKYNTPDENESAKKDSADKASKESDSTKTETNSQNTSSNEEEEEINPNNERLRVKPHGRFDRKKQEHVDAVWDFLELLNIASYLDKDTYTDHMRFVREIHTFRKNVENLFQSAQQSKSDASTIHKMITTAKSHIQEAKDESKSAIEIKSLETELVGLEEEHEKQQGLLKKTIKNVISCLKEYDFLLKNPS